MAHEGVAREVPASLLQQTFREYGIVNARADDYEIDFLTNCSGLPVTRLLTVWIAIWKTKAG